LTEEATFTIFLGLSHLLEKKGEKEIFSPRGRKKVPLGGRKSEKRAKRRRKKGRLPPSLSREKGRQKEKGTFDITLYRDPGSAGPEETKEEEGKEETKKKEIYRLKFCRPPTNRGNCQEKKKRGRPSFPTWKKKKGRETSSSRPLSFRSKKDID